jgi:hypothetical protein
MTFGKGHIIQLICIYVTNILNINNNSKYDNIIEINFFNNGISTCYSTMIKS